MSRTTSDSNSRRRNSRSAVRRAGVACRAATARDGSTKCRTGVCRSLAPDASRLTRDRLRLREVLRRGDADGLETLFRAFFAGIPHQWYTNNDIARYEGYYASVFNSRSRLRFRLRRTSWFG